MDGMVQALPEKKQTERNASVDVLRGIAILMVVLGHTMSGCTLNSQDTFLFRIIWSLQMPLFMLISGYVTKYSKPIVSGKALLRLLKKRSLAYLVPWLVWTIGVRGFLLGESNYLDIPWLLWHMDSGYWFLFSLWTITVIFATSQWAASKVHCEHGSIRYLITLVTCYGFGAAILLSLGVWQGLSFLCIKLTLYYMPFYFAGYLFGAYQKRITSMKNGAKWMEGIVALCCIAWLYLVIRFNFYTVEESVAMILLRMATSLLGCIAISGLCSSACAKINRGGVRWFGVHSLEVYLMQYPLLTLLMPSELPQASSMFGVIIVTANIALTCVIAYILTKTIGCNTILQKVLFVKDA